MSIRKKRHTEHIVHGVTERGIDIGGGAFLAPPPVLIPIDRFVTRENVGGVAVWGYRCLHQRCPGHFRHSTKWDEVMARHAFDQHRADKHGDGPYAGLTRSVKA